MIGSSKKGLPVLIASLAVTSAMFAGNGEVKPNNCKGPTLCHTRPDIDSNDLMIDVGFILEQARVTGTQYGYTIGGGNTVGGQTQSTSGRRPSYDLDWGVTVGVGRHFDHDDWDLKIGFDWISSNGKDNTGTEFNEVFVPTGLRTADARGVGADLNVANSANTNLKIQYYMLDVMLGRGSFIGSCHSITPHFGIKAAWIDYSGTSKFAGGDLGATTFYYQKRSDDFWGVGPQAGVNGVWGMAEGIGWFVDNKMSILLGYAKIDDHQWFSQRAATNTIRYSEGSIPVLSPSIKMFFGLQYEKPVYYGCQHLRLRGGWDTVFYFNQFMHSVVNNQLPDNQGMQFWTQDTNNFGLTGLRVDLTWDF